MEWTEIYSRLGGDREDQQAWDAVTQHIRTWAQAHLRRLPWHAIEDVVADTCSSVAVSFERAHGEQTFAGFVYGCYLNERRRAIANERKQLAVYDSAVARDRDLGQATSVHSRSEDRSRVWEALVELPPRERAAVTLRHLEGMSARHVAVQLGISPGCARQLVHRALLRLRRQLSSERSAV